MKAMFMSDLQVAKKYLGQQLVVALLVGCVIGFTTESLYLIVPMLTVVIPFSLAFTIIAYDERGDWQQFRLALPLSRVDVITGRYASIGALVLLGAATGLVLTGIILVAGQVALDGMVPPALLEDLSWQGIMLATGLGITIILLMLSVTLPLVSRFGMTKAVRYLPLAMVLIVLLAGTGVSDFQMPPFVIDLVTWVNTPSGTVVVSLGVVAIAVLLYAASTALSVKLYAKREL